MTEQQRSLYARCQHGTFRLTEDGTETTCAMCQAGDNEGVAPFVPFVMPTDCSEFCSTECMTKAARREDAERGGRFKGERRDHLKPGRIVRASEVNTHKLRPFVEEVCGTQGRLPAGYEDSPHRSGDLIQQIEPEGRLASKAVEVLGPKLINDCYCDTDGVPCELCQAHEAYLAEHADHEDGLPAEAQRVLPHGNKPACESIILDLQDEISRLELQNQQLIAALRSIKVGPSGPEVS